MKRAGEKWHPVRATAILRSFAAVCRSSVSRLMTMHSLRRALLLPALAFATSCESGTDPEPQNPIDLVLDFCANEVPVWMAYRNEGADWVRLTPTAEGSVSFTATNDVALAFVRQDGSDYHTEVVFAANTELEAISGVSCREESGAKTVNGTVSGVVGSQVAQVGMSYSSVYLSSAQTSFTLAQIPDRTVDLVASRSNVTATTQLADRVVIRRAQTPITGSPLTPIDFAGASALATTAFGATITGVGQDFAFLQNYFVSQLGTEHLLAHAEPVDDGSVTLVGVPQAELVAGDYHDAFLIAVDGSGGVRGIERFFRAPATQTLPLGAAMPTPAVTEAASTPSVRLRASVARTTDYQRAMSVQFVQQQLFSVTTVTMTMTSGYDATGSWEMTMPDLSGASGWQNAWGFVNGGDPVDWTMTVFGGRPELLFGAAPVEGETVRFAGRTNSTNVAVARAVRGFSARFPRFVAPSR